MKMKLNRVFWLLSFLFVVMSAHSAFATLLPISSYQGGAWYGESTYTDNGFQAVLQMGESRCVVLRVHGVPGSGQRVLRARDVLAAVPGGDYERLGS